MKSAVLVLLLSAFLAVSSGAYVGYSGWATNDCQGDVALALFSLATCSEDSEAPGNYTIATCGEDNWSVFWTCSDMACSVCTEVVSYNSSCMVNDMGYGSFRDLCYETAAELPQAPLSSVIQRVYTTTECTDDFHTVAFFPNDVCVPLFPSATYQCNTDETWVTLTQYNSTDCTGTSEMLELPTGCTPLEGAALFVQCFGTGNNTVSTTGGETATTGGMVTTGEDDTTTGGATTGDDDTTTGDDGTSSTSGAAAVVFSVVVSALAFLAVVC